MGEMCCDDGEGSALVRDQPRFFRYYYFEADRDCLHIFTALTTSVVSKASLSELQNAVKLSCIV